MLYTRTRTHLQAALALPVLLALAAPQAHAQLKIIPTYDSTITSDANSTTIKNTIQSAINVYQATFINPVTVNITFGEMSGGLGQSLTYINTVSYADYTTALKKNEQGQGFLNSVPNTNPLNNGGVTTTLADLRTLGFSGYDIASDSTISLNTSLMNLSRSGSQDSQKYDLMAVASHEIDEVLGLGSALNGLSNGAAAPTGAIGSLDLFRYSANGTRSFNTSQSTAAYLSADGGKSYIVYFNQTQGGDFHDFYSDGSNSRAVRGPAQVQDAFGSPGTQENLGSSEITALQMVGYNLAAAPEPSAFAAFAVGLLGLGALALKARKRTAA